MVFGNDTTEQLFNKYWAKHGFAGVKNDAGTTLTVPVQRMLNTKNQEALKKFKGITRKQMTATEVEDHVPLIFDPEILSILKEEAPFLEMIPIEGQQGYKAVFNFINSRDAPLGFKSESDVIDLSGESGKDIGFDKGEVDMTIYVDIADISDFTQAAAEHYMDVADTTLGERVKLYAQRKEQQILYGDPSQNTASGWVGDASGYKGLATLYNDKSNAIDKSGKSDNFIKDIKKELAKIKQEENVNVNDLRIITSHTFFDVLSQELVPENVRFAATGTDANIGIQTLRIKGVPVLATHNVDTFVDEGFTVGDEGDVFIVNMRAVRFRALVPFSTVPLARVGLSERTALFEFGALIERTNGNWGRHLKAYNYDGS